MLAFTGELFAQGQESKYLPKKGYFIRPIYKKGSNNLNNHEKISSYSNCCCRM